MASTRVEQRFADNMAVNAPATFTGADMKVVFALGDRIKVVGELQTITYSVHREKNSVNLLGHINPVGFTRASRTLAGTMIFSIFNKEVFDEILQIYPDDALDGGFGGMMIDQLPPLNVTITFQNEDGYLSSLVIYGIDFVDDGQTMSINDMMIENVKSYKARGMDLMWENPNGVWTDATSNPRKFNSRAVFQSVFADMDNRSVLQQDAAMKEYHGILFQISETQAQIDQIDENIVIMLADINLTDRDNMSDSLRLEKYKLESQISRLQRAARQKAIMLNYSSNSRMVNDTYSGIPDVSTIKKPI